MLDAVHPRLIVALSSLMDGLANCPEKLTW